MIPCEYHEQLVPSFDGATLYARASYWCEDKGFTMQEPIHAPADALARQYGLMSIRTRLWSCLQEPAIPREGLPLTMPLKVWLEGHHVSVRAYNVLTYYGNLSTLEDALKCSSRDLLRTRMCGRQTFNEIETLLRPYREAYKTELGSR
jgi:hypothetical protein